MTAFFFFLFSFEKKFCVRAVRTKSSLGNNQRLEKKEELTFNSLLMTNFIVKSHVVGKSYAKPHFFVLNKGLNSGKPQNEPFTNSFVLIFQKEEDKEDVFWIASSLWKSKFWMPYLRGSVIPFLALYEFQKEFFPKVNRFLQEHEQHQKNVKALQLLQQQEAHHAKNIHLINELRNAILMRYRNK